MNPCINDVFHSYVYIHIMLTTPQSYGYIRIDGKTPSDMRQAYCDQFQHDEKCLVAVLSITTANAGT